MKTSAAVTIMPLLALATACATHADRLTATRRPAVIDARAGSTTPSTCRTSELALRLGTTGHAAGSTYRPIVFTNRGTQTCTLSGFPGVSFVASGSGKQIGAAASRSGSAGTTVRLAAGGHASALLQIVDHFNFPAARCAATSASGLRVYPPRNTAAAYIPFGSPMQVCSTSVTQLTVRTMVKGATGM